MPTLAQSPLPLPRPYLPTILQATLPATTPSQRPIIAASVADRYHPTEICVQEHPTVYCVSAENILRQSNLLGFAKALLGGQGTRSGGTIVDVRPPVVEAANSSFISRKYLARRRAHADRSDEAD